MEEYCCETMMKQINNKCPHHPNPFECPDNLIYCDEESGKLGIIIHDGGELFGVNRNGTCWGKFLMESFGWISGWNLLEIWWFWFHNLGLIRPVRSKKCQNQKM